MKKMDTPFLMDIRGEIMTPTISRESGFTLIELIVVMTIIGIVSIVAIPKLKRVIKIIYVIILGKMVFI